MSGARSDRTMTVCGLTSVARAASSHPDCGTVLGTRVATLPGLSRALARRSPSPARLLDDLYGCSRKNLGCAAGCTEGSRLRSEPCSEKPITQRRRPSVTWQPVRLSVPQRQATGTSGSAPDDMRGKTTCRTHRKAQCPPVSRGEARRRIPIVVDRQSSWLRKEEVPTAGLTDSSPDE